MRGVHSSNSTFSAESFNRKDWVVPPSNTLLYQSIEFGFNQEGRLENRYTSEMDYLVYTCYKDEKLIKREWYWDNSLTSITNFHYDVSGNMVKEESFDVLADGSKQLSSITSYEFDNYMNPFKGIFLARIPGEGSNPNNITRKRYELIGYSTTDEQYSYQYNSKGFPQVSSIWISQNGLNTPNSGELIEFG